MWRWATENRAFPSGVTPMAVRTAQGTTAPPCRTFSFLASRKREVTSPSGLFLQALNCSSSSAATRLTCVDTTSSLQSFSTPAVTFRVLTPLTSISATASVMARSLRKPRSRLLE